MIIQIEPHTLQRANERGASENEIKETIETGANILGKSGRLGKSKVFPFNNEKITGTLRKETGSILRY